MDDAERFALGVLIDLSRLIPVDDPTADVVRLELVDSGAMSLRECVEGRWPLELSDGLVRMPRGTLRETAMILLAKAEQEASQRDRLGRIPSETNALVQGGFERDPVISRAGGALRGAAVAVAGRRIMRLVAPWPESRRWAAAVTHDLDVVSMWPVFTLLRLAELSRKRRISQVATVIAAAARSIARDPVTAAVDDMLHHEREHGIRSTWFVLCGSPTLATYRSGDLTYRSDSTALRRILDSLAEHGAEIGLHGSMETVDRDEAFAEQRTRLRQLTAMPVDGVRQHFLRMRPGTTYRGMTAAGFTYDSTVGFPDRNGFRLGVADVVPVWDAGQRVPGSLVEVPFCWMDRALSKYRGVERPLDWVADAVALARTCREVEGLWVGVWHPNLTPALGYPGAPAAFVALLKALAADDPWFATLEDVVRWRATRRSFRIRAMTLDGRVARSGSSGASPSTVALEDSSGRRVVDAP